MQPKRTIYIRIRDLRRERELTQEELAEALGISRQSINAMEAGRCLPSLPVALQIAAYFAVPLQRLIAIADENERALAAAIENGDAHIPAPANPWEPLREMRDMLDDFIGEAPQLSSGAVPLANMREDDSSITLEFQLPGFAKDDISIDVSVDHLTVSGEAKQEQNDDGQREFSLTSFSRTLALPAAVETDSAQASMKNGILRVQLHKQRDDKPKSKRLEIQG
jgi:HSP20 family protein